MLARWLARPSPAPFWAVLRRMAQGAREVGAEMVVSGGGEASDDFQLRTILRFVVGAFFVKGIRV